MKTRNFREIGGVGQAIGSWQLAIGKIRMLSPSNRENALCLLLRPIANCYSPTAQLQRFRAACVTPQGCNTCG